MVLQAIVWTVLSFNLVGEGVKELLDPRALSLPARLASDYCDGTVYPARDPEKRTKVNRQNCPQALPAGSFLLACGHIGELFA